MFSSAMRALTSSVPDRQAVGHHPERSTHVLEPIAATTIKNEGAEAQSPDRTACSEWTADEPEFRKRIAAEQKQFQEFLKHACSVGTDGRERADCRVADGTHVFPRYLCGNDGG